MQIKKDYDVVHKAPPSADQGTNLDSNPQIKPAGSPANSPGTGSNSTEADRKSKGPPSPGKKGGGYYS